mmetsp:Transcript_16083/g.24241  ORF Transcript_16083/g.24241 Transcript_16083/m.24241 type:complete len:234 (+) Transcript_16083:1312-2013(+)
MRSTAACEASLLVSTSVTGIPALAKHIDIPAPMVPPPITPTDDICGTHDPSGKAGGELTALSEKNMYCIAGAWLPDDSSSNSSLSLIMPLSNGRVTAARAALAMFKGALNPLAALATFFSTVSSASSEYSPGTVRPEMRLAFTSAPCTFSEEAKVIALATKSSSEAKGEDATSSIIPSFSASLARKERPDTINSSAFSTPMRRGRRCVPPAPGRMPRCTSGNPTDAVGDAILQ